MVSEKIKILVVDDLEINRKVLKGFLSIDYEVLTASSGEGALELLSQNLFHMALLDVHMPNMDGIELAHEIRKRVSSSELPIIFVTGAAIEHDQVSAGLSAGAVDYVCKPFDTRILILKVNNFVEITKKNLELKKALGRERRLRKQLKLAEKMETVGRLATGISHDFNNLMTALTGHAELMKGKLEKDDHHLDSILSICDVGIDISEKLKVFSRTRSPRMKVIDLVRLLKEVEQICDVTIEPHIDLSFKFPERKIKVMANASDLQNCFLNLIINARDSLGSTKGSIEVKCETLFIEKALCEENPMFDLKPGDFARVSFIDDGCGMDTHTLSKIFEPFYTEKDDVGTGLGLSNSLTTVTEHSGCIEVESDLGKGTKFDIYIPLSTKSGAVKKERKVKTFSFEGVNIVVVDDDESTLNYMYASLIEHGAKVKAFSSGNDALEFVKYAHSSIDLVVLDLMLADISTDSLHTEITKSMDKDKLIYVTGSNSVNAPTSQLLVKPFHLNDFLEFVSKSIPTK